MRDAQGQWPKVAANWKLIGPPLRPVAEDIEFCQRAIDEWTGNHRTTQHKQSPSRALVLGVTPEYVNLAWPDATVLHALDRTPEMIKYIWPGKDDSAILGTWENMPLQNDSIDFVLCDGGLHLLEFPTGQQRLISQLTRIVRTGGLCIFRLFSLPDKLETPDEVRSAVFNGEIKHLNQLKLRLGMALQSASSAGVKLDDVYRHILSWTNSLDALAARLNWDIEFLRAIEAYKGLQTRYHFTSTETAIQLFIEASEHAFKLHSLSYPKYPMGNQCPTVIFSRI